MSEQGDNSFKSSSLKIIEFSMEQDVESNQKEQEMEQNGNIQKNQKNNTHSKENKIRIHESQDLEILQFDEDNEIVNENQQQKHHLNETNANYKEESDKLKNTKFSNSFQPIQQQAPPQQILPQEPTEENPDLNQHEEQFCGFKVTMVIEDPEQVQLQHQNNEQNNFSVNKQNQFQEQNQIYSQQQEQQIMIPNQIYQPDNQYYPQQNQQYYQQNQYNQNNIPIQQYPDQPYPIQQYPDQEDQEQQQQLNGKNKKNKKLNPNDPNNSNQNKKKQHQEQTNSYQNRNMIIIPITSAQEQEEDKDSQSRNGYNGGVHLVSNTTTFCCFSMFDTRDNCCQWICDCIVRSLTFPIILMKMLIKWIWNCCLHDCCDFFCPSIDKCCAEGCNLIVFSVSRCCRYLNRSVDGCCQLSIKYVFQCINCVAITQFFLACCNSCAKCIEDFFSVICYGILVCFQIMGDKILVCMEVLCSAMGECLAASCGLIVNYMDFCCKMCCEVCGCVLKMLI